jgi:predicted Co/Zn/Cd cation transporter (cation efflux family)
MTIKRGLVRFIEISVLVPAYLRLPVTEIDVQHDAIGHAIGVPGPDRRITITFTNEKARW